MSRPTKNTVKFLIHLTLDADRESHRRVIEILESTRNKSGIVRDALLGMPPQGTNTDDDSFLCEDHDLFM